MSLLMVTEVCSQTESRFLEYALSSKTFVGVKGLFFLGVVLLLVII